MNNDADRFVTFQPHFFHIYQIGSSAFFLRSFEARFALALHLHWYRGLQSKCRTQQTMPKKSTNKPISVRVWMQNGSCILTLTCIPVHVGASILHTMHSASARKGSHVRFNNSRKCVSGLIELLWPISSEFFRWNLVNGLAILGKIYKTLGQEYNSYFLQHKFLPQMKNNLTDKHTYWNEQTNKQANRQADWKQSNKRSWSVLKVERKNNDTQFCRYIAYMLCGKMVPMCC